MRRRGTSVAPSRPRPQTSGEDVARGSFQFMSTPGLGRAVVAVARGLVDAGCRPAEAASLLAHAAAALAKRPKGLGRSEWLALCAELWDGPTGEAAITTTGGEA